MLEIKFFPYAKKRELVKKFHFMQNGATPHCTRDVFESIHEVYSNRMIGLGYPKLAHAGFMKWPPYSLDLNLCVFFLWSYFKDKCYTTSKHRRADRQHSKMHSQHSYSHIGQCISKFSVAILYRFRWITFWKHVPSVHARKQILHLFCLFKLLKYYIFFSHLRW